MSYHSTSGTATNTADFLTKLKDFLVTTVGWTMHDDGSSDANPYYVLKSVGESGVEDVYLQFWNDTGTDRIAVKTCLYWNATTHAAVKEAYSAANTLIMTKDSASFLYWLYADLDHVFAVTKISTTYYGQYSGLLKRFWSGAIAITQSSASSGTNVVVQVSNASIFTAGNYYIIKDNANIERVQVTARDILSNPNTVTIATLVATYAAGSKIGEDPQPSIVGKFTSPGVFYAANKFDGWASAIGQLGAAVAPTGGFDTSTNPDVRGGLVTLFPWFGGHTTLAYKELRGEFIEVYSLGAGGADSEDVLDIGGVTYKVFNLSVAALCAVKE